MYQRMSQVHYGESCNAGACTSARLLWHAATVRFRCCLGKLTIAFAVAVHMTRCFAATVQHEKACLPATAEVGTRCAAIACQPGCVTESRNMSVLADMPERSHPLFMRHLDCAQCQAHGLGKPPMAITARSWARGYRACKAWLSVASPPMMISHCCRSILHALVAPAFRAPDTCEHRAPASAATARLIELTSC